MESQRSQARLGVAIIAFFGMIVVGALLWTLFNEPVQAALDWSLSSTSHPVVTQYVGILDTIWGAILYFVLALAGLMLLGRGILEGQVR